MGSLYGKETRKLSGSPLGMSDSWAVDCLGPLGRQLAYTDTPVLITDNIFSLTCLCHCGGEWGSLTRRWHPSAMAPCPRMAWHRGCRARGSAASGHMWGAGAELAPPRLLTVPGPPTLPQSPGTSSCPLALLQALLPSSLLTDCSSHFIGFLYWSSVCMKALVAWVDAALRLGLLMQMKK